MESVSSRLLAIVPSSCAYARMIFNENPDISKDAGVLDIGYTTSTFTIFRKGKPLLSRSIPEGGQTFSESLTGLFISHGKHQEFSIEQAEELKGNLNFDPEVEVNPDDDIAQTALQRLRPHIERLQKIIQSTLDFYQQQAFAGELQCIFLCGSGSRMQGLDRFLQDILERPVLNPTHKKINGIQIDKRLKDEFEKRYIDVMPVVGAFLSWRDKGVNLLPKKTLFLNTLQAKNRLMRLAAVTIAALFIFMNLYEARALNIKTSRLATLQQHTKPLSEFEVLYSKLLHHQKIKHAASQGELELYAFMKFLSWVTPSYCVIQDITYEKSDKNIQMRGKVIHLAKDPVGMVAEFIRTLEESPFLKSAKLVTEKKDDRTRTGEYTFLIQGEIYEN